MNTGRWVTGFVAAVAAVFVGNWHAYALDTVEPFDEKTLDVEFYLSFDGIGRSGVEKLLTAEFQMDYGITKALSTYFWLGLETNPKFTESIGRVSFGLFGTAIDTDHFDLDLMVDAGFWTVGLAFTPAIELNFDLEPDLKKWGMYLRVEEILTGYSTPPGIVLTPYTHLIGGTYWAVRPGHDLLLEFDSTFAHNARGDERAADVGGIAVGYNVMLTEDVEMINEIYFDVPMGDELFSAGIYTGFIFYGPAD